MFMAVWEIYLCRDDRYFYGGRGNTIFWSLVMTLSMAVLTKTHELQKYSFSDIISMNVIMGTLEFENNFKFIKY